MSDLTDQHGQVGSTAVAVSGTLSQMFDFPENQNAFDIQAIPSGVAVSGVINYDNPWYGCRFTTPINGLAHLRSPHSNWFIIKSDNITNGSAPFAFSIKWKYISLWSKLTPRQVFLVVTADPNLNLDTCIYRNVHTSETATLEPDSSPVTFNRNKLGALLRLIYKPSNELKDHEIGDAIEDISNILNDSDFLSLDALFESIDTERISIEMMLVLLRTSFMARDKIANWFSFLDLSMNEVERRGRDPKRVFRGLKNSK
jgi:hypothetical protein